MSIYNTDNNKLTTQNDKYKKASEKSFPKVFKYNLPKQVYLL